MCIIKYKIVFQTTMKSTHLECPLEYW